MAIRFRMRYNRSAMNELYAFTVPVFTKSLGGVRRVLEKAKSHGLSDDALLNDRLAPDMFPFVKQVQIACDNAKGAAARLAGIEPPKMADDETTVDALLARIDATVAFLSTLDAASYDGAADRRITLAYFPGKYLTGYDYAREYALPNFFFHVAMAYALVRKNGVAIGKADYLNGMPLRDE